MTDTPDESLLVLLAEDDPLASMALRAQLEALGYRVLGPARNGDEAVALAACFPVDLAVLDVRMPGRSGLDAARDLFGHAPTPVVLLTGVSSADLPDPLPRPPVFELISKPVGLDELRNGLRSAREDFLRWRQETDHEEHDDDDRHIIARAITATAAADRPATAAARLLESARQQDRSPVELAREILDAER